MLSAIELTMKLVGGKWKCLILYHLGGGARRTRDLLERLGGISPKVLTEQLSQLEARRAKPFCPRSICCATGARHTACATERKPAPARRLPSETVEIEAA